MKMDINPQQRAEQAEFRAFVDQEILPVADLLDREEKIPSGLMEKLANKKYFGPIIPKTYGGMGMDIVTYGLLHEEIGRGCSSVRSLLTVHDMVAQAILRWGSPQKKEYWMPRLASGEVRAAFALTEPNVGSDAKSIEMTATDAGDAYILN
ncbi:MAG: acyl-CoA dehydrogenase family protein, partial [Nitrososphaera sp.]|nr:acyl-CoA dehydrogenase family protein [Nitrososphaera sp.]